jgi:hypothetical protein
MTQDEPDAKRVRSLGLFERERRETAADASADAAEASEHSQSPQQAAGTSGSSSRQPAEEPKPQRLAAGLAL